MMGEAASRSAPIPMVVTAPICDELPPHNSILLELLYQKNQALRWLISFQSLHWKHFEIL